MALFPNSWKFGHLHFFLEHFLMAKIRRAYLFLFWILKFVQDADLRIFGRKPFFLLFFEIEVRIRDYLSHKYKLYYITVGVKSAHYPKIRQNLIFNAVENASDFRFNAREIRELGLSAIRIKRSQG